MPDGTSNVRAGGGRRAVDLPRRWRVYCTQWVSCRWKSYRTADTREQAIEAACPRCGGKVTA